MGGAGGTQEYTCGQWPGPADFAGYLGKVAAAINQAMRELDAQETGNTQNGQ